MADEFTVTYEVTGYEHTTLMVKFSLDEVSETLWFHYVGEPPIEDFLGDKAKHVAPRLREKRAAKNNAGHDLRQYVGKTGTVAVTDDPLAKV